MGYWPQGMPPGYTTARATYLDELAAANLPSDIDGLIHANLHVSKFTGFVWYVDAGIGTSGDGTDPHLAFKTIKEGTTAASAGDRIRVKTGTYDEDGLDLKLPGLELCGDIGTLIVNTEPGTCLTISGNACLVSGIKVKQAGQVGFAITGAGCALFDLIAEDCTIPYDIDGANTLMVRCQDVNGTITGYDISSAENLLYLCNSMAGGGNSRGFYLSHTNAHQNMLYQCLSLGNGTAGYETVVGADYNAFAYCTSGGGDGARVDAGSRNTWPNFAFENHPHTIQTFTGGGGGSTELFRIYGIVEIMFIYGIVETDLSADVDNISLDIFPDGGSLVPLATLVDSASAPAGSIFVKATDAGDPLVLKSSVVPFVLEQSTWRSPFVNSIIGEQGDGTDTHIRSTYSGVATSGAIDWHIEWRPLSDDGFVAIA